MTDDHGASVPETRWDHPTESELAEVVLGRLDDDRVDILSAHVRSCVACRVILDRLGRGLPDLPAGEPPSGSVAVPEAARAAVMAADRPKAGPQAGELWRARHTSGGPVTLVWVRARGPTGADVVPVSFDTELADDYSLVVPGEASPLAMPLVLHVSVETTIDDRYLLDRLGSVDVTAAVDSIRAALRAGEPVREWSVGAPVTSPVDERIEFRHILADDAAALAPIGGDERDAVDGDGDRWPIEARSERAALLMAMHDALGETHPAARIAPRPPMTAGSERARAVALVAELDAFVLVASVDPPLGGRALLDNARDVLQGDQLLNAVCLVEPVAPFEAVIVDRRDVVAAIETPSGELRPPRQGRPPAPIGEVLTKFLDAAISPFGRLSGTVVDAQALDSRALAVDVSADAVRQLAASARGFKVEGKRPGYERVTRHQAAITRLVEDALNSDEIDVASIMEDRE